VAQEKRLSTQSFAVMLDGYSQACARFQDAAKGPDANAAYTPLFEALNWAVVLDDRTRKHWAPDGEVLGWAWRTRVPGAEVMAGVRFARNRAHHQWSDALRLDASGFQFPMTFPLTFSEWVWRSADELPEGDVADPDGEAVYRNQLEGRAARVTLTELGSAFAFLRRVLEPGTLVVSLQDLNDST
jgi:hypothetical protein